jgi:RND family efflux transporter MFP subunit
VGVDKADLKSKELDLEFTKVLAPVTGRISRTHVTVGNLVQSGQAGGGTLLTTIVSVDPIWAYFDVDTNTMLLVQELIGQGRAVSVREHPLPVTIDVSGKGTFPFKGEANFVDNQVNQTTGTIRLRATVPNPKGILYPGQFVRVRVPIGMQHQGLLITDQAVETSQGQKVVYKVVQNKDGKDVVEPQPVTLGRPHDGRRVVLAGLSADDRVIVNGLQRVRPGSVVEAREAEMPKSTAPAEAGATPAAKPAPPEPVGEKKK